MYEALHGTYVGLASASPDLGKQEIDTEGTIGILEAALDLLDLQRRCQYAVRAKFSEIEGILLF